MSLNAHRARASTRTAAPGRRRIESPSRIVSAARLLVRQPTAQPMLASRTRLRRRRLRRRGSTRRFRRRRASSMSMSRPFVLYASIYPAHPRTRQRQLITCQAPTPPVVRSPSTNPGQAVASETYQQDGDYIKDIEINDLRNRYTLTKGAVQKRVNYFCHPLIFQSQACLLLQARRCSRVQRRGA
jgi:hypothetical protein